ncbi:MAG: vitamin B12 dependent-methionine synthase activation domain-containing protein [Bacillota bacterium]
MEIVFDEKLKLDRTSWLRLLGVSDDHLKAAETDEKMRAALDRLQEQMDEAEGLLFETARPAFAYAVVDRDRLAVSGESLARHLEGCGRIVVSAVTLGQGVDDLITGTQVEKIALGVVIDSGASVMTELAANMAQEKIRDAVSEMTGDGVSDGVSGVYDGSSGGTAKPLFMTERFSPGYGDSPLEMQAQLLEILDAENQLGITLSKGFMMSPSKSITGIMGLADHPVTGRLATCAECVLRGKCALLKEGRRCYD